MKLARPALRIAESGAYPSYYRPNGGSDPNVMNLSGSYLGPVHDPKRSGQVSVSGNKVVYDEIQRRLGNPAAGAAGPSPADSLVIDSVLAQYRAFVKRPSLSSLEKQRIQAHVDQFTDLQRRIGLASMPRASQCSVPASAAGADLPLYDHYIWNSHDKVAKNYNDLIAAAFACDVARIVVMPIFFNGNDAYYQGEECHKNSHRQINSMADSPEQILANVVKWNGYLADKVKDLLAKLDAMIEFDGSTTLDNTVVLWGSEMGASDTHEAESLLAFVAGGRNAGFNQGNYVDFTLRPTQGKGTPIGRPNTSLLVTIMKSLGMQPEEYMNQGSPGGFGQVDDGFVYDQRRKTTWRNQPLPFLFRG
jgi:hypothetical protein